jgi:DNA-binding transcriptional LysR family regulator
MDKLSAMQAFVRVVEAGTFTKAADLLDAPKPTVTRLVQSLEKQLDTKLLHRTTRRVTVTPDGAAYYDRAVRLLGELDDLESSMSRAKAAPRGRLRVDLPASAAMSLIIPALPDFHARYPDIQLDLGVSDKPVDLVSENVDCAVRGGTLTDPSLVARRIGEVQVVTCATPDYLKRHGVPKHPADLEKGHTMVRFASPKTGRFFPVVLTRGSDEVAVNPQHAMSANDANACLALALAGLGVTRVMGFLARPHIASGLLVPVLPEWTSVPAPVYVVYPPNRHLSLKVRVFVDWVAELFAKHRLLQSNAKPTKQGRQGSLNRDALAALSDREEEAL